jgi:PAS domain-containing protein
MIDDKNFANLFRQTPEMVCILAGPEHRFEFVNEAHIRALGFDATGQAVRQAQPESVEVHGILDEVYRTGVTAELREIAVTLTDRTRYFDLTYAARRDGAGVIDGIMIMGSEVTEKVLARRAQEHQRRWLEAVLNRLPSPTLFLDPSTGDVAFQNDAARRLATKRRTRSIRDSRQPSLARSRLAYEVGFEIVTVTSESRFRACSTGRNAALAMPLR